MAAKSPQPASSRYLFVLLLITFLGFFFAAFDTIIPDVALPVIIKDLHMTVGQGGWAISIGFLGTFITGLLIGPVMDRIGRKRSYRIVLLATAVFSGISAVVGSAWQFAVVRLFAGSSLGTIETAGVLVAEESPPKHRGLLVGIVQAAFPCGAIAATYIASLTLPHGQWRILFLVAFIPAIIVILLAGRFLRETPRFQEIQARRAVESGRPKSSEWKRIFSPELRRQTLSASIFALLINMGVGFIVTLSVTYLTIFDHLPIGLAALALTAESFGTLAGQLGSGWLADYMSPRDVLLIFGVLGAVSVFLLSIPGPFGWVLVPMVGAGIFGQGILGCLPRYAADSFPSSIRGTGTSVVIASYWLGVIFMPAVYGSMIDAGSVTLVPISAAVLMLAGVASLLFARRIKPRQDIDLAAEEAASSA